MVNWDELRCVIGFLTKINAKIIWKKKKNGNACVKYDAIIKLKTFDRTIVLIIITIEKKSKKTSKMQTLGNEMYIEEECVKLFVFLNVDY